MLIHRIPIPPGSKISISNHAGEYIASGSLLEDYRVSLNSEFKQLFDTGGNDAFAVLGGALKSLSAGAFGFSAQFKQMGISTWAGTSPIQLDFSLEFHYTYNAFEEVVAPIRRLCKLPVPGEGPLGNLIPPGPSVLEAIAGTHETNVPPNGEAPLAAEIDEESTRRSIDSYVNITVGNMRFMGCILKTAEPTFSKYVDEGNHPIYGRVAITAITMYTATKESLDRIMR